MDSTMIGVYLKIMSDSNDRNENRKENELMLDLRY